MKITSDSIGAANVKSSGPEFVDSHGLRALFGISRSQAYDLANEGAIRSVCIRREGAIRGKRLWVVSSVRAFLNKLQEAAE